MKKYKIEVTITKDYEVEIDDTIYNEKEQEIFESIMWDLEGETPAEGFAKSLAEQSARLGVNTFLEGFGLVPRNQEDIEIFKEENFRKGMFIREIDEGIESEVEEVDDFD